VRANNEHKSVDELGPPLLPTAALLGGSNSTAASSGDSSSSHRFRIVLLWQLIGSNYQDAQRSSSYQYANERRFKGAAQVDQRTQTE
jgi:hypothetical protein